MLGKSGFCPDTNIATNVVSTMPTPDQTEYTIPSGSVLVMIESRYKAITNAPIAITVGSGLEKPLLALIQFDPITSITIAKPNKTQGFIKGL